MVVTTTPDQVVRSVASGVCRLAIGGLTHDEREQQLDDLASLYADTTCVRHPLSPLGDSPLRTRAELRAHFADARTWLPADLSRFEVVGDVVHHTLDPETVIFEFRYAIAVGDAAATEVPCVFVVRVREGQIVESRDYADHLSVARAIGRLDGLLDELAVTAG